MEGVEEAALGVAEAFLATYGSLFPLYRFVFHTIDIYGTVSKGETKISVEHHLFMFRVASRVYSLPLVLVEQAVDRKVRSPSLCEDRAVVIVIENTLVLGITPKAVVTGVVGLGASEGVSAQNCGCHRPRYVGASEDLLVEEEF